LVERSARRRKALRELLQAPVLGAQFLFEASDPVTGVTSKAKRHKKNKKKDKKNKTALVKMKLKDLSEDLQVRAQFSDQYSELDDEITSLINVPTEKNLLPIEMLSLPVV